MNEKIVKKTQDTLGKIIKKPPLTEKLLNKPPFRFLHDVITSVIKTTGFMKGLYPDDQLNSENVKDKDSKVAFLQKAIDLVTLVNGKSVSARPSKIVAGHEPEKTNEFLQALASAINKKVDNDEYVAKVLGGEKGSSASKKDRERDSSADKRKKRDKDKDREKDKEKESKQSRSSSKKDEKKDDDEKDRKHRRREKDRDRSRDRERSKERGDKDKERRHRDKDRDRSKDREDKEKSRDRDRKKVKPARGQRREKEEDKENDDAHATMNGTADDHAEKPKKERKKDKDEEAVRAEREREERRHKKEEPQVNGQMDDAPQQQNRRLARPSSARPAPPRVKKNEAPPEEQHVIGPSNVPNLIVDKKGDDSDDDDDGFLAKEDDAPAPLETEAPSTQPEGDEEGAEHGGLVKKILETKKELEGGSQQANKPMKKTEIERAGMNDATQRKHREMVQKEIEKLRGTIQTLTRSANPLGKIMDFVQEDLDQMQKELEMWKKEHKENTIALQREQSITESSIEPLKAQLAEYDSQINDQLDIIAAVKSNLLRNDDKIEKMLSTVTQS